MIDKLRQKLSGLFNSDGEDRGVSPVIGVILMVAITVILAAVIGAFVLNLGGDLNSTPSSNLAVQVDSSYTDSDTAEQRLFSIDHNGGDSLESEDIQVVIRDGNGDRLATLDNIQSSSDADAGNGPSEVSVSYGQSKFGVGDRVDVMINLADDGAGTVTETAFRSSDEITVQLIHKPSDGAVGKSTFTLP